jgi:hypothetical protein
MIDQKMISVNGKNVVGLKVSLPGTSPQKSPPKNVAPSPYTGSTEILTKKFQIAQVSKRSG